MISWSLVHFADPRTQLQPATLSLQPILRWSYHFQTQGNLSLVQSPNPRKHLINSVIKATEPPDGPGLPVVSNGELYSLQLGDVELGLAAVPPANPHLSRVYCTDRRTEIDYGAMSIFQNWKVKFRYNIYYSFVVENWSFNEFSVQCSCGWCELRNVLMVEPLQKMPKLSIDCIYLHYRIYRYYT